MHVKNDEPANSPTQPRRIAVLRKHFPKWKSETYTAKYQEGCDRTEEMRQERKMYILDVPHWRCIL